MSQTEDARACPMAASTMSAMTTRASAPARRVGKRQPARSVRAQVRALPADLSPLPPPNRTIATSRREMSR